MIAGLEQYLVKVVSHHCPSMLLSVMVFSKLRGLDARDSLMLGISDVRSLVEKISIVSAYI
jgi:hypothetical protein